MPQCRVYGCNTGSRHYKGDPFHLYGFPKDDFYKRQWCVAINYDVALLKDHDKLCSRHFADDDLEQKKDSQGRMQKIPRPKPEAVPSKFLDLVRIEQNLKPLHIFA